MVINRLLYFSPVVAGGLADYADSQAAALVETGVEVEMLVPGGVARAPAGVRINATLMPAAGLRRAVPRRAYFATRVLRNAQVLRRVIKSHQHSHVLFGAFSEYFAPLWSPLLRSLRTSGVVFGAVVHDPIRDYVIGPQWWHDWSVQAGYSLLREAFVHEDIAQRRPPSVRFTVIPHGVYTFPAPSRPRSATREQLALPEDATVLLAFGHIRDAKNLDLVIRAMRALPGTYLVVAGVEQSAAQKPVSVYQELARQLLVDDRCRWLHRHIPQGEIGDLFNASDVVLLTYSASFVSASGVLSTAVHYRRPCVTSGGATALRRTIEQYGLGTWIKPDCEPAISSGIKYLMTNPMIGRWEEYRRDHSWSRNAELVKHRMFEPPR